MKTAYISCIVLLCGVAWASDVLEPSDDDFAAIVNNKELILVEFFAPWCGHCKRLAPEYEKAATALASQDPPIPLAKVDCTESGKETCGKYGVSGYPTLKVFRNGDASDYQGPREADGIISYMKKQAGPKSKELKSVADVESFLSDMDAGIIGFFSDESSSDMKEYKKAADSLFEDFRFAYCFDPAAAEKYGAADKVVLFRPSHLKNKFEDNQVVYEGAIKKKAIETFIKDNINGLCGHMTPDNSQFFKKPLLTAYYDVDYKLNVKGTNYWRNRVIKVAKEFSDQTMYFAVAQAGDFSRKLDEFGLDFEEGAPVVAIEGAAGEKFVMSEKFSMDELRSFLQKYFNGELEQYLKSEPVPEDNDGPVKVVVAKTFDEIVRDETKDVLIEFYAPWCGHCKSLEPKYNELGEKLQGDENIVIAKMDATANDVPSPFDVRGFPTLYWAPKNNKSKPKKYEGGREVDDFVKFIKKEATSKPVNLSGEKGKTEL
ncbi:protein disulfide-isomerase A3-like [Diadema antillarum]|uniref:protein disulfide-isomerase A3-like n=2 Tax=Diadema antillarum TaxID=105358 RepID=UPI003A8637E8